MTCKKTLMKLRQKIEKLEARVAALGVSRSLSFADREPYCTHAGLWCWANSDHPHARIEGREGLTEDIFRRLPGANGCSMYRMYVSRDDATTAYYAAVGDLWCAARGIDPASPYDQYEWVWERESMRRVGDTRFTQHHRIPDILFTSIPNLMGAATLHFCSRDDAIAALGKAVLHTSSM